MKSIVKGIREGLCLSQVDFAKKLGVSFSTVNRWENGRAYPNQVAQMRIYELAKENEVNVLSLINKRIEMIEDTLDLEEGRVLLYHGSKRGIKGEIAPISRVACDFGQGFYMGTIPEQPLTLICSFPKSKLYIVSVDMSNLEIGAVGIDFDWAMFVAYNRRKMESIKGTKMYQKYASISKNKDIIKGNIANDRMFFVIDSFFQGLITDVALIKSLSALKLGQQYVAVTKKACEAIRIEREIGLSYLERETLKDIAIQNRSKGVESAKQICKTARREGRFYDEILEEVKNSDEA